MAKNEETLAELCIEPSRLPVPGNVVSDMQQLLKSKDQQEFISWLNRALKDCRLPTAVPILSEIFHLNGQPYSLRAQFTFEDLFRFNIPASSVWMTGRQTGKSTGLAASSLFRSISIPNFRTLYVTPLFDQIRRFSTNYVQHFINGSPIREAISGVGTVNSVLHRTFYNNSQMQFSYAFLNADRIRGISCDFVGFDEIQDMNRDHIDIILETMSHSPWEIVQYTGTPKTRENTLTSLWQRSSQAEWFIPCTHCTTNGLTTWNIPSIEHHLLDIIGPTRDDISFENPATICHKCRGIIRPQDGRWVHRKPKEIGRQEGRHVPQIIMPIHYAKKAKWERLMSKRLHMTEYEFHNEVLGEPSDVAAKLVSMTELEAVSVLGPNTVESAVRRKRNSNYIMTVLAVDWGGGGQKKVSWTTAAFLGLLPNGTIEVPFGLRMMTPHDHLREAAMIRELWNAFRPSMLAHDYTGAGALRETFLVQSGLNKRLIFPSEYVSSASQAPCVRIPSTPDHPREHYRVDKSRSLLTTCSMVKTKKMRFFNWDRISDENPGLISDFMALIQESTKTAAAGEIYRIDRMDEFSDDFAQAVNIGCVCIWNRTRKWPNIAMNYYEMTMAQQESAEPSDLRKVWADPQEVGTPGDD